MENALLRRQLAVLNRQVERPQLTAFAALLRRCIDWPHISKDGTF
jgi:hypothetical protein